MRIRPFASFCILGTAALVSTLCKSAQPTQKKPEVAVGTAAGVRIRPGAGTIILAELRQSLNTAKLKPGDKIKAEVIQDLLYKGKIIIPRNVTMTGTVKAVKASTKSDPGSELEVAFNKVVLRHSQELAFEDEAIVLALAPRIRDVNRPSQRLTDLPLSMPKGRTSGDAIIDAVGPDTRLNGDNELKYKTGIISAASRGVIGLRGLQLVSPAPGKSIIVSKKGNVKLEYGMQLVVQVKSAPQSQDPKAK